MRRVREPCRDIDRQVKTQPWGERCFYAKDPFGNPICMVDERTVFTVFTGGVNYYLYGFGAKFTLDVSYLPNGSPIADDAFGILTDNRRNEIVVRGQFQLVL